MSGHKLGPACIPPPGPLFLSHRPGLAVPPPPLSHSPPPACCESAAFFGAESTTACPQGPLVPQGAWELTCGGLGMQMTQRNPSCVCAVGELDADPACLLGRIPRQKALASVGAGREAGRQ